MRKKRRKPRSAKIVLAELGRRFDTLAGMYRQMRDTAQDPTWRHEREGKYNAMVEAANIVRSVRP